MMAALPVVAQRSGNCQPSRPVLVPYDDENAIRKAAWRESPYFLELTGRWNQKETDSSLLYQRTLEVEKYWKDYRVILNVRCGRACRVMLNGKEVGYADDSRQWNEFDLNGFLKYGKSNTLVVEGLKHPDGALLERDDLQVGLNGEPYLVFKSDPGVYDVTLTADYDHSTQFGTITLDASVFNSRKKGKYYLEVEIWDPRGRSFDRMGRWVVFDKESLVQVDFTRSWPQVEPWTAETPTLYSAVIRLRDSEMEEEEVVGTRFGFRRVEVAEGVLRVNGRPVTLKGVTYGIEHTEGQAGREQIRRDLTLMKHNNINAVRTSRYSPMEPFFYELCDELGLYVVCDANLMPLSSQHQAVATDNAYIPLFQNRVENMYGRYKNHPSILLWSLGDTRDNAICMAAAYKHLKELDPSRPVVFSGADFSENTDIIALAKPTVSTLKQALEKMGERPYLMLSSVGDNNFASLDTLWSTVQNRRELQGGFVDVWPLSAAKLAELKSLYSPFDVQLSKIQGDDAEFLVYNRNDFSDFSKYILEYTIFTNLRPNISSGDLPIAINGGGVEKQQLLIPPVDLRVGEELFIRFDLIVRPEGRMVRTSVAERTVGTLFFPLPTSVGSRQEAIIVPLVRENDLLEHLNVSLTFAGHENWRVERVDERRRQPDSNTVCIDRMERYLSPSGTVMCDVRTTSTHFASNDVVIEYTIAPAENLRVDGLVPEVRVPHQGDSIRWFGLDREICFHSRNSAMVGTFARRADGFNRQQVRWCAAVLNGGGLFAEVIGHQSSMKADASTLILAPDLRPWQPTSNSQGPTSKRSFAVHLCYFGPESPDSLYGYDYPSMEQGMLEPPLIKASTTRFSSPLKVTLATQPTQPSTLIRYTLDGSDPTSESPIYKEPFTLTATTIVKARAFAPDMPPSFTATRKFSYDYIVSTTFSRKPSTPFNVGTDTILFDGETGSADDLSHGWLGFSAGGVETTVTLSKPIDVEYVTLRFAHVPDNWAFAPMRVAVLLSSDGINFTDTVSVGAPFDPASKNESYPHEVVLIVPVNKPAVTALKIDAVAIPSIPAWHRAKGLKPWILMDEIMVEEGDLKQ
jgi:hypothetical protein